MFITYRAIDISHVVLRNAHGYITQYDKMPTCYKKAKIVKGLSICVYLVTGAIHCLQHCMNCGFCFIILKNYVLRCVR